MTTKRIIEQHIDTICDAAGKDLAIGCKAVLAKLTESEILAFTQSGQYPYRIAKTLLCSISDRIEDQWSAESTLKEIKALKRIRKARYC